MLYPTCLACWIWICTVDEHRAPYSVIFVNFKCIIRGSYHVVYLQTAMVNFFWDCGFKNENRNPHSILKLLISVMMVIVHLKKKVITYTFTSSRMGFFTGLVLWENVSTILQITNDNLNNLIWNPQNQIRVHIGI